MDDLEAAEAYRREAEFYKEKAEENIQVQVPLSAARRRDV